ncbi:MAG TPA: MEDS domain-containing protein [Chloroflexota bacterium]|nr:MEDS domain-containing protein [Chloroflexota bacterium]
MNHSVHFYESRPLLVDWLYRSVREAMQAGDMCVVIARPDIREPLERLLDLQFDVTAASAWGLYAYVYPDELVAELRDRDAGIDAGAFGQWLVGIAAEARAAGRQIAVWAEIGDELARQGEDRATRELENLWETAPAGVCSVTCLYAKAKVRVCDRESTIRQLHGSADSAPND